MKNSSKTKTKKLQSLNPACSFSISRSQFSKFKGTRLGDREPLRQSKADLKRATDTLERIHDTVVLYSSPFLIAISSANLLWKRLHSTAMRPVVVKTKGVKIPCSTSRTLFAYSLILMFTIQLLNGEIFVRLCVWVKNPHVYTPWHDPPKMYLHKYKWRACQQFASHSGDERHP